MKKTLAPSVIVYDHMSKGQHFLKPIKDAYNSAQLTLEEAQRVNEAPGLSDLVKEFIAENRLSKRFANEEVSSNIGYVFGYTTPKPTSEQCKMLRQMFPGLGYAHEMAENPAVVSQFGLGRILGAPFAEGWFAIPNWMKYPEIFGKTYSEAVKVVLDKMERTLIFHNYRGGRIDERLLRQSTRSIEMWKKINDSQGNPDILIVACQFGIRHHGRSIRRAIEVMNENEFGLGAFALCIMLLTHPKRLSHDNLWIDCAGDEYAEDDGKCFSESLCLNKIGMMMGLSSRDIRDVNNCYGSASCFLPCA